MTTVYYNFPVISIPLLGKDYTKEIQLGTVGQPTTNILLNDVNYTAYSIIIAKTSINPETTTTPGHLIVKCYADINDTNSNLIYFAIPLQIPEPSSSESSKDANLSDVDNIINAKEGTTSVNLNLNNYIKNSGTCVVPNSSTFPLTITLSKESSINIQSSQSIQNFYNSYKIPSLNLDTNVTQNKNASLQQQELDWIMSCELLTEDGPTKSQVVDPGTTATTISLFMMAIIISGATYLSSPIIYNELGLKRLAEKGLGGNHYTINIYWRITLILSTILCIIQGVNHPTYYFIAFSLILSFFAGTSAILKIGGIANSEGTGFANKESAFRIYFEIFSRDCYSTTGFLMKMLVFASLAYAFLAMIGSMAAKSDFIFTSHLMIFIIVAFVQLIAVSYFNKTA